MAADSKKVQPIIIKRIKKGGHAAHGGAWKIAYADFVTAMMAFFLLMWLLGSTTDGDKKGIADYFNAPMKVSFMGGTGAGDATSVLKGGGKDLTQTAGQVKDGDKKAEKRKYNLHALKQIREQQAKAEAEMLSSLKEKIEAVIDANGKLSQYKSQIRLDMTAEGLRIQIVDDQNRPMFDSGSSQVQGYMQDLLRAIGHVLQEVPNKLTIEGHTDALAFSSGDSGYSNWELSADRANGSRRELIAGGLSGNKVLRVQGLAASILFDKDNPESPMNRRISIIVMNRTAEDRMFKGAEPGSQDEALPKESSEESLAEFSPTE